MAEINKVELTPYQQELANTIKTILEYKKPAEANVVSILYKDPELFYSYDSLNLEMFHMNEWKVYYSIISEMVLKEKLQAIDEISVGLFLEKHPKLQEKFVEYGGWNAIKECGEYVKVENFDSYLNDLKKWNAVLTLAKNKFPVHDMLSDFADLSLAEIYDYFEVKLNNTFIHADTEVKSYDISDGIDDLIDKMNKGVGVGLPLSNMSMLNKMTAGLLQGNIFLVGAASNVGKSLFVRNTILPSVLENKEKIVVMMNEEGRDVWQSNLLIWVVNNILKKDFQKFVLRDGHYSEEQISILRQAAKWIKDQKDNHIITLIPMEHYSSAQAIKIIKKYSSLSVKYYIIDTLKLDADANTTNAWLELQQASVNLYNCIKEEAKNVNLVVTYQLEKSRTPNLRYYNQSLLGMSKNILDVVSTAVFIRDLFEDEYSGGKNELKVYRIEGNGTKIPIQITNDVKKQVLFVIKNRNGDKDKQIVFQHDMSRNVIKECGVCFVPQDGYGGNV